MNSFMAASQLALVGQRPSGSDGSDQDLRQFQAELLGRYRDYCTVLQFEAATSERAERFLRRLLHDFGLTYLWEVKSEHVSRLNLALVKKGRATSTRRAYCSSIRSLFAFLIEENTDEIQRMTGVVLVQPVTKRNSPRMRSSASTAARVPPSHGLIRTVSRRLREHLSTARTFAIAARNLVMFETLYLTAMRSRELRFLDVEDVHFRKGDAGQVHVRFGKGSSGSGPRPRWVPMLDGLETLLAWYMREVRPKLAPGVNLRSQRALFLTRGGGRMSYSDLGDALESSLKSAVVRSALRFSLHRLRHARASHLFESGMNLVAIQRLLGHVHLLTTQTYVHVAPAFVARAHRNMVRRTLQRASS